MVFVYVLHSAPNHIAKIGVARDLKQRVAQLVREHGELTLVRCYMFTSAPEAFKAEKALHHWFRRELVRGEWFAESILSALPDDISVVIKAYKATRIYEVRLDRDDVTELERHGMTVEDCVARILRSRLAAVQ